MNLKFQIAGRTDKGKKRSKNEDNFDIDEELGLMLVADGMGGHSSGEIASKLAADITMDQIKRALHTGQVPIFKHVPNKNNLDKRTLSLGDCIKFSNKQIFEAGQSSPKNRNMGTTLVTALCLEDKLAVAHVGDSRLYLMRDGELIQITTDHSFIQEQIDRGLIKPEDAEKSDMRNMLTRSVGVNADVAVDVREIPLKKDDYILICSDGLTKMMDDDQIADSFKPGRTVKEIVDELIARSLEAGGLDNVTVVVGKAENAPSNWDSLASRVKKIFMKGAPPNGKTTTKI